MRGISSRLPFAFRGFVIAAALILGTVAAQAVNQQVIYNLPGGSSGGANAHSNLVVTSSGLIYGTAASGGFKNNGTVFELRPKAGGGWNVRTIHFFKGGSDGYNPVGNIVFDASGNLYGATSSDGGGTVYQLAPNGNGSWTLRTIYSFQSYPNANTPYAGLTIDASGNLYGTTNSGGANGVGAIYKLSPNGDGTWSESVLYSFGSFSGDGQYTWAEPVFDAAGNIYGTTVLGGAYGSGTVYRLSPNSDGTWTETILYSFTGQADQGVPKDAVWLDSSGNIFGTASADGTSGAGTVFELSSNSNGSWTEKTLHTFGAVGDGYRPFSNLTPDAAGNLYGTTYVGGAYGAGCVYRLHPGADGRWSENVVYSFTGLSDGNAPATGVTLGGKGVFYGGTELGGSAAMGVIYALKP
jgi:uncharacterized repeat protein (TIGR03803 family)